MEPANLPCFQGRIELAAEAVGGWAVLELGSLVPCQGSWGTMDQQERLVHPLLLFLGENGG